MQSVLLSRAHGTVIFNPQMEADQAADLTLGALCCVCCVIGTALNTTSLLFFSNQHTATPNRRYFKRTYQWMATTDLLICVSLFPVAESFLSDRRPVLFRFWSFCHGWGVLWEVLPSLSVSCVAVLLYSRMLTMRSPLRQLNIQKLVIFSVSYPSFILVRTLLFLSCISDKMDVVFSRQVNYCYLSADNRHREHLIFNSLQIFTVLQLGLPVIPIVLCFLLTVSRLRHCRRKARLFGRGRRFVRAINTTLLVVVLYIIFNVPVFINYCYYGCWLVKASVSELSHGRWVDYGDYYNTAFLRDYSWVLTYVVSVAVNSTLNPCIYYRMILFKSQIKHSALGLCLP